LNYEVSVALVQIPSGVRAGCDVIHQFWRYLILHLNCCSSNATI